MQEFIVLINKIKKMHVAFSSLQRLLFLPEKSTVPVGFWNTPINSDGIAAKSILLYE